MPYADFFRVVKIQNDEFELEGKKRLSIRNGLKKSGLKGLSIFKTSFLIFKFNLFWF